MKPQNFAPGSLDPGGKATLAIQSARQSGTIDFVVEGEFVVEGRYMTLAKSPPEIAPQNMIILPLELESNEPELDSDLHREAIDLLVACLKWHWRDRNNFYVTGNLTIYYNPQRLTTQDFRGPDFFVVLGTENRPRKSWLLWAEAGQYPNVIVELLSDSTASVDRGLKKQLYQDRFRTPEYFWFHPETLEFKGFRLHGGKYRPIKPNQQGWFWSQQLDLFLGVHQSQLRFFTPGGELVPTAAERAEQAQQQAEIERQQREQAQQQAKIERQQREQAQQQAKIERQQREQLQQQLEELQARLRQMERNGD